MRVYELLETRRAKPIMEGMKYSSVLPIVKDFIKYVQFRLELDSLPSITLSTGTGKSVKMRSFGGYGNHHVRVSIDNRHIMDVLRSLAHEMVHYKQDLEGLIKPDSGQTGSPIENEANAAAAILMRDWGREYPEMFDFESISPS